MTSAHDREWISSLVFIALGLAAPKGTPKEIIKKLEAGVKTACADEGYKKMVYDIGALPVCDGSEEFTKKVQIDYEIFKETLDRLGLSAK